MHNRWFKILVLTLIFALCSLGIAKAIIHIALVSPIEIAIILITILGAMGFLIYKGLMKLV